jgi:site-specific recombinase XerC
VTIVVQLRDYLHRVCHSLGLPTRIAPHQFRHTYATEMLRSGVSFPVLMKLLGHVNPDMTMRYVDVALTDLEREFKRSRQTSGSTAQNIDRTHKSRPRRPHRLLTRRSTCHGDVPPLSPKR